MGMGLNILLGVITTPIITRLVDPVAYGGLSLFTLFGNIFMLIALLGHDQSYGRFYYANEEAGYKKYILGATSKIPIAISILVGALVFLYYIFTPNKKSELLPIFSIYLVVLTVGVFSNFTIRLNLRTKLYSLIINIQKLFYVIFVVLAVHFTNIEHVIILAGATVASQAIVCIIGIVAEKNVWNMESFSVRLKERYESVVSEKEIVKYGLPFIFANLCNWVFTGADKVMIKFFSTGTELGIYASAVSVVGIFGIITTTFNTIWGPLAVEEFERKKEDRTFFIKMTDYVCILMFVIGAIIVLGKDIIVYLLGEEYRNAAALIPFLTLHPIMYTLSESTVYGINFAKKTQYHIFVTFACCILNVILNLFFIPLLGSLGASISTGISYTMFFVLRTFLSVRCFKVNYNYKNIILVILIYYVFIIYSSFNKINFLCLFIFLIYTLTIYFVYKIRIKELIVLVTEYAKDLIKKVIRCKNK